MLRPPAVLAALADAAVPGLRPRSFAAMPTRPGDRFQSVRVIDADDRDWTVRMSLSPADGAGLEQADRFASLLAKRVPFAVPRVEGRLVLPDRTAVIVQRSLPGSPSVWRELAAGDDLARSLGRALAVLHEVDPRVADEAGVPAYDADGYRARRLATLDRAATTGLVPSGLLARWERALEEVSLWKFATCVTHGPLEGHDVLSDGGEVRAITGWERAAVGDPADDFAALHSLAPQDAFDTVLETYAGARSEAPDGHLVRRIRLSAELQRVTALLEAVQADDEPMVERRAAALRRLDEQTEHDESLLPATPRPRPVLVEPLEEEPFEPGDIEAVEVREADEDEETVEIPTNDQDDTVPIVDEDGESAGERRE
ncbi:phosphotransferase [Calidifontibacter sp. DB0510]|uniref:Phosphotransferase n=1 Tax=Metallococcus carri TaxID=1656884 RepID=A0A967B818_9MICO|nr:phosphotransferase [Metallococcus carri]NHN56486.1 phosphotransferase [Metallococcus carri]NOP36110.1 phosphotransferase [Calidifontibacter sp. DB2511S]